MSQKPYTVYKVGRARSWRRLVAWILIVLAITVVVLGAATFVWLNVLLARTHSNESDTQAITKAIEDKLPGGKEAAPPKPGSMNILVLGSDMRQSAPEKYGRSDTLMIVHVDTKNDYVSVLSLPRDLRIDLGRYGHQKINAAYAFGGIPLTITTIRELTGLTIDKYVHVDFDAFRRLTVAFGGVWVDVDRRYLYAGPDYERIDVQPGYQLLSGNDALQFVRFRHDLNGDYGRIDRQQRFVRGAKEQAVSWGTAGRFKEMVEILASNVGTNLNALDITKLAWWGVRLESGRIKQVNLQVTDDYIGGVAYVLASGQAIQAAATDLTTPPASPQTASSSTTATSTRKGTSTTRKSSPTPAGGTQGRTLALGGVAVNVYNAGRLTGAGAAAGRALAEHGAGLRMVTTADKPLARSVVLYPAELQAEAAQVALALGIHKMVEDDSRRRVNVFVGADFVMPKTIPPTGPDPAVIDGDQWTGLARSVSFPLMAPRVMLADYTYAGYRIYELKTGGAARPSLKVMYKLKDKDQYLGIMETTFADAPAAEAGEKVKVGERTLTVVSVGDKVDHIWWREGKTLYWVSNTLAYLLSHDELLAVAKSMVPVQ